MRSCSVSSVRAWRRNYDSFGDHLSKNSAKNYENEEELCVWATLSFKKWMFPLDLTDMTYVPVQECVRTCVRRGIAYLLKQDSEGKKPSVQDFYNDVYVKNYV